MPSHTPNLAEEADVRYVPPWRGVRAFTHVPTAQRGAAREDHGGWLPAGAEEEPPVLARSSVESRERSGCREEAHRRSAELRHRDPPPPIRTRPAVPEVSELNRPSVEAHHWPKMCMDGLFSIFGKTPPNDAY
jgi:hypothetical protein